MSHRYSGKLGGLLYLIDLCNALPEWRVFYSGSVYIAKRDGVEILGLTGKELIEKCGHWERAP